MARGEKKIDRPFLFIVVALVVLGLLSFISASFADLLENRELFMSVLRNQIVIGLLGGALAMYVGLKIPIRFWKKYAFLLLFLGIVMMALVWVPGLGFSHGGARRWLTLGVITFQPAEFLKVAYVVYLAAWFSFVKDRVVTISYGFVPIVILSLVAGGLLLMQPDTGTLMVLISTLMLMYFMAGGKNKHILILGAGTVVLLLLLLITRPYVRDRVMTFINPSSDRLGSSWQVTQSAIALGNGGLTGRGYGQSVQKYNYLPEPAGDSILAVIGEEMGFLGIMFLLVLYVAFLVRGFKIALNNSDLFNRFMVVGLVLLIVVQSFVNIASIVGIIPLTGLPLIFISHGGTALLMALFSCGLILNISRHQVPSYMKK